jgi:PAS domain-containing protein
MIGRTVREAIPEVVDQGFINLLDRVYAGERYVGEAMPLGLAPGSNGTRATSFVDFIYEPIVEADGTISGIFVEGYEVTDRVRAERALRGSEEQLRLATGAAEVGLWDVDGITGAPYGPRGSRRCPAFPRTRRPRWTTSMRACIRRTGTRRRRL